MLSLLTITTLSVAPNFDSFLTQSLGKWTGASFSWQKTSGEPSIVPLGVAPGFVSVPTPCSTEVTEIMRSCGGAVQGVQEERQCQPADGTVALNRQVDGTTFFSYGSWAVAPPMLSDAEESDMLSSTSTFGLSVCLAHADETRRRLLVVVSDGELVCCDVAVEGRGAEDCEAAAALLEPRLQCITEANSWEGGATKLVLSGTCAGGDWLNARTKWELSEGEVEGGAPLVPSADGDDEDVAYMPGGSWVRIGGGKNGKRKIIEVGSVAAEAAEVKVIRHEYEKVEAAFALSKVVFEKVQAME